MTDEQILELAKTCGFYVNGDKLWMSWEEELLEFSRAIYENGYNNGYGECSFDMGDENV